MAGWVAVATETGLFLSTDGGDHWDDFSYGLAPAYLRTLATDAETQTLYAGSVGGGLFSATW